MGCLTVSYVWKADWMNKIRIGRTEFYIHRKIRYIDQKEYVKLAGKDYPVLRDEAGKAYIEWADKNPPDGATTDKIIVM